MSWKEDLSLKDALEKYVRQNLKRIEILDFVNRDFAHFFEKGRCSLRTLARMLSHFDIKYINYATPIDNVRETVKQELGGSGKRLGYRALNAKLRQEHNICVPRDTVYAVMTEEDPDGLRRRKPGNKCKKRKGHYVTKGVNSFLSIDGHDKLMGYQNSTFPLAVYGMMDQASRKIIFLKVWTSNSDPRLIGRWYIDMLTETRTLAANVRLDCGTETGKLASIHAFLRNKMGDIEDPMDSIFFGPSTSNQIERWWRELHDRLEKIYKFDLNNLMAGGFYNPNIELDRKILAFIMIPVLQRELNTFKETIWNSHRIRYQRNTLLPDGIPNHIYDFPDRYGLEECGYQLSKENIQEAAGAANVYPSSIDYLTENEREKFSSIIPFPEQIESKEIVSAFKYFKRTFRIESI